MAAAYAIEPLNAGTWDAFARLVERHNGVAPTPRSCSTATKRSPGRSTADVLPDYRRAGGGVVEGYPHDTGGKKISVLYNGTRSLYERAGFDYVRPKGTRNCVMRRIV